MTIPANDHWIVDKRIMRIMEIDSLYLEVRGFFDMGQNCF
jgi:hypothetical protein